MKEKTGEVFSIAGDNKPVEGCTVSREIHPGENSVTYFSLAEDTDISAEIYPMPKLLYVADGSMKVYTTGSGSSESTVGTQEMILTPVAVPVGVQTETGAVYVEINLGRKIVMNKAVKAGEVFKLAELVPYQDGKIVNMDVAHNEKMKFVVMAFDAGTGLSEHAAPGEAVIFALDGNGIIGYEGKEYPIKAGENFHFAKGGLHSVKAVEKFKMALLLTLE